ncbi:acetyl-CoA acetyltransferase [Arenicella chitinivorans]|uniref:Acetyl-CoA acetyltransferase n=1 Tax=Arenicella chitinivorans TaxID=1329800 RepID=A0A918S5D5_9GAMM|nr:acetyl-CoA acetyltransferase [Arenicella chitinivorans]GHA21168.1 acetyl-CoA acetyltransferase [Arenicella chitinivorans]
MKSEPIYILGGHQTDLSRNIAREGASIFDLFAEVTRQAIDNANINPDHIGVGHVANFESALYTEQSHLGGFFGHVDPALTYLPASRHEAACASGSMALLAAMADLKSENYDTACVVGLEVMRCNSDQKDRLKGAGWVGEEWQDADYMWPAAFSDLIEFYQDRYGLERAHLAAISKKNFANARSNPNAQSRNWDIQPSAYASEIESINPTIHSHIRKLDCGQVTDGAAALILANQRGAEAYANSHRISVQRLPKITGWGHVNAPMRFAEKLRLAHQSKSMPFPHVQQTVIQALTRAGLQIKHIDGIELHDCFNITEYLILDHMGLRPNGEIWQAIESGYFEKTGVLPVNASGGLIGLGHPVGATGIRMVLDCYKQVTGTAGDTQIDNAKTMMTFNVGGSTTTCASFVVEA